MRPPRRRRMPGSTSWVSRTRPKKLVSNWRRISAIGCCSTGPYSPYPALLISTLTPPASASTAATARVMDDSSVTSKASVSMPRLVRSVIAAARPIPDEQPVMSTTSGRVVPTMVVSPSRRRLSPGNHPNRPTAWHKSRPAPGRAETAAGHEGHLMTNHGPKRLAAYRSAVSGRRRPTLRRRPIKDWAVPGLGILWARLRESEPCLGVGGLGEREDLDGRDREDEHPGPLRIGVQEHPVTDVEVPVDLLLPCPGKTSEQI